MVFSFNLSGRDPASGNVTLWEAEFNLNLLRNVEPCDHHMY